MSIMRWFKFGRKKQCMPEIKYWYAKDKKVIKECNGKTLETDYIFDYYSNFDGMTYLLWIDSITSNSDDVINLKIGCVNKKNAENDKAEIQCVTNEYQKIKAVMEMIKVIRKNR